ncbi:MAG TPA: heparinase II/III family protein [Anaeromyxobacter sp.]|nr:heparinase II/III family protein [Anaeromyxobacter sp.]
MRRLAALLLAVLPFAAYPQQHPHVLFGAGDVARLRSRAATTHAAIAQGLTAGTDEFMGATVSQAGIVSWPTGSTFSLGDLRDVGNGIAVFAFVWQLQGTDAYLQLAREWLLTATSWPTLDLAGDNDLSLAHAVIGVAIAYDILYGQLADAERAQVVGALVAGANQLYAYGSGGGWWEREWLQNHNWINHAAVGFAALALQGEIADTTTAAWLEYARANAAMVNATMAPIGDGGWHEGPGYLDYGFTYHLPFTWALARAGGQDLTDNAYLRGDVGYRAHAQIAEKPWQKVLTYGDFFGFPAQEGVMQLRFAASQYRDTIAQAVADRQLAGSSRFTYAVECMDQLFEFLFYDPSVPSADLSQLPLDWYGDDLQAVVFRSGWGPGSTLFAMKSGPMGGRSVWERVLANDPAVALVDIGHDHADDNGFYLNVGGSWLAPEAEGYYIGHPESPLPAANQTIYHNALTIDGVGQAGEGVRATDNGPSLPWYGARTGSIPFHGSTRNHAYAVADGSRLYPPSLGLTRWDRHALFLGRRWVVLRDVVRASAAHDFHWLVHFLNGAAQDGTWLMGTADGGRALGVAVVSPAAWNLTVTQQSPRQIDGLNPAGSVTGAEVAPASPTPSVTFLTALVPTTTASWSSRPTVVPLDAAQPEAGLVVTAGTQVATAIFSDDPTASSSASGVDLAGLAGVLEADGAAPTRVLLVQARSLSQGGALVASQDGTASILEAEGLGDAELRLTGDVLGTARVRAPSATRVTWFGKDVPFARDGDYVDVNKTATPAPIPAPPDPTPTPGPAPSPPPPPSPASPASPVTPASCSAGVTADLLALIAAVALLRGAHRRSRPRS